MSNNINNKSVLIIGAGITGATAADRLGRMNFEVYLIEKLSEIGGRVREMGCKASEKCQRCNICVADEIFRSINQSKNIHLHTSTELIELNAGNNNKLYTVSLKNNEGKTFSIDIDSIIVATGHQPYNPKENSSYGYGNIPNIITGAEAEKQLSENYMITRTTDGKQPKRIAFIQCVGSRTEEIYRRPEDTNYCSTVCCTYALRMANKIKYLDEESEITIFYMDIQKFGRGFDKFFKDSKKNINFIRSRPYEINQGPNNSVSVKYTPTDYGNENSKAVCEEDFDLLILSVGIRPDEFGNKLADKFGIAIDEYGFFGLKGAAGITETQRENIYVAGTCESPKDITGSMAQAEAVCSKILVSSCPPINIDKQKIDNINNKSVIVIGGGIAGLQTAVGLAELNHNVSLLYKDSEPGGIVSSAPELYSYLSSTPEEAVNELKNCTKTLISDLRNNQNIKIYPESIVKSINGELGNFSVDYEKKGNIEKLDAGIVVLATGSNSELVEDENTSLINIFTLLEKIRNGQIIEKVAFILDTTSEHGRSIWGQTLSAAELLINHCNSKVTIYCKNVRVASTGMEKLYRHVRELGVTFYKSDKDPSIISKNAKITITSEDPVLRRSISEEFDYAVLENTKINNYRNVISKGIWKFKTGPEGELQYDNIWLLPGMTNRPGIYCVGNAHGNSEFRDATIDGMAAAGEIHSILTLDDIDDQDTLVKIDEEKCVLCLTCMRTCPHGAITIDNDNSVAKASQVSCKRCGICTAICPAKAIILPNFTDENIAEKLKSNPKTVIFACENSAIPASEMSHWKNTASVKIIEVPCAGKIDSASVLSTLESGAEKVVILGCHPEACHYLSGSARAAVKMEKLAEILDKAGFDKSRISFGGISAVEPGKFTDYVKGII
ncbi:MAG TPA: FAD-dependent oxidoreductase [Victivallales bacterium]|nr:FAD-dependent oxidoreductase [Victivallales bacterium]